MSQLLERFTTLKLPDAIDAILLGVDDLEQGSIDAALARYASRLLGQLGASRMRDIAVSHDVDAGRLGSTDLFWLRFNPDNIASEEYGYLLAAEGVMNRLRLVEEEVAARAPKDSLLHKGDQVTEGECALADLRTIEGIAQVAPKLSKGGANPLAEIAGAVCARGGEWDLRTRLALALESVRLPYRLVYQFDCNAREGIFRIDYTVPDASWMPRMRYQSQTGTWQDAESSQGQMAEDYALRLGAVVAAAAFGAGVGVRRLHLVAHPVHLAADSCLSLRVERVGFLTGIVSSIAEGDAGWLARFGEAFEGDDPELDEALAARHTNLSQDQRQLPADLRTMLLADEACELDVLSDMEGERWDAVREARQDHENGVLVSAVALLEDVVHSAGDIDADGEGRFPLYCSDAAARMLVREAAVSSSTRYFRYSDAAFAARSLLCDLYLEMGEPDRALQQAQAMIQIAPTSTAGYTDAAYALFELNRHPAAVDYLKKALALATQENSISWIYYRLAYALWQDGSLEEGLACYVMSAHHGFPRAEVLSEEVGDLLAQMGRDETPTFPEALETLRSGNLELPWSNQTMRTLATAAMRLADEGFFSAAAPLCTIQGLAPSYRDELFVVARSFK